MTAELKHIKIKIFINIKVDQFSNLKDFFNNEDSSNSFAVKANGFILERNNKILSKQIIIIN